MYVRVQNYLHNLMDYKPETPGDFVPVNISGRNQAQTFARIINEGDYGDFAVGIVPVFDFRDASLATVVRLFGSHHHSGIYSDTSSVWEGDNNLGVPIKLNGNTYHGWDLETITSRPNYVSVPQDNIGIPTP